MQPRIIPLALGMGPKGGGEVGVEALEKFCEAFCGGGSFEMMQAKKLPSSANVRGERIGRIGQKGIGESVWLLSSGFVFGVIDR